MLTDQLYQFVDHVSQSLLEQTGIITVPLTEAVRPIDGTLSKAMIEWIRAREGVSQYLALRGEGLMNLAGSDFSREPVTKANFTEAASEILDATSTQICGFMTAAGTQGGTVHLRLQNMAETIDTQLAAKLTAWYDAVFPVRLHILGQRRRTA